MGTGANGIRLARRTARGLGVALVLLLVVGAGAAHAETSAAAPADANTWGYALAHELMSPYCPGRTLAACTSGQAAELRQWILLQEAAGASREEVIEVLYQRFGAVIRSTPEAEGWGLAAYAMPIVALLLGAAFVVFGLRRMVGRSKDTPAVPNPQRANVAPLAAARTAPAAAASDAELERAFEEELRAADA